LGSCHNWSSKDYKENGVQLSAARARNIDWQVYRHRKNGDTTDTFPFGYALTDSYICSVSQLFGHVQGVDFLSLEYYKGELKNEKRLLRLLSKRMKNEIDDETFANGHFIITQEEYLKEYKRCMGYRVNVWKKLGI